MTQVSYVVAVILAGSLFDGCGGGPVTPTAVDVSGTWDATFEGIVQGAGTTQTSDFTMELSQSGTNPLMSAPRGGLVIRSTSNSPVSSRIST